MNFMKLFKEMEGKKKTPSVSDTILLVDGTNTFIRAFSATHKTNKHGEHIGGIIGFLASLGGAVRKFNPKQVIIVFDGADGSIGRKILYADYKANRKERTLINPRIFSNVQEQEESKDKQLLRLVNYLECMPVTMVCLDFVEADDILGYLAVKKSETKNVVILSNDKDFFQLIDDNISVYNATDKKLFKSDDIYERFGVYPYNFLLYRSFLGDVSDNIPNIEGLGDKGLLKILPDLRGDKKLSLNELLETCVGTDKKSNSVRANKPLLETNIRLMDLRNNFLNDDHREDIDHMCEFKNKLNSMKFNSLHLADKTEFQDPIGWLMTYFSYLN